MFIQADLTTKRCLFFIRQHLIEKIEIDFFHYIFWFGFNKKKLFFLEVNIFDVEVDLRLLLERYGVEAEPLEGLDLALVLVDVPVVQVDVLWRENAVWNETNSKESNHRP